MCCQDAPPEREYAETQVRQPRAKRGLREGNGVKQGRVLGRKAERAEATVESHGGMEGTSYT